MQGKASVASKQSSGLSEYLGKLSRKDKASELMVLVSERPVIIQMAMEVGEDRCPALV
jgi:hypothetical protein